MAAQNPCVTVRFADASAAKNVQQAEQVTEVMSKLLKDADLGVRKVALRFIKVQLEIAPKEMVMKLATNDPDSTIRDTPATWRTISHRR